MRTFCNKKAVPMLFILLSLLLFPAVSFAEYVGSFSRIEGRVDLLRAGATTVVPARRGDGVSNGDIIRTKSDGRAEILFKDDTTVTVASETRLKIDEYTFNPDNSRNKGILSLLRGKLRAAVSKVKAGLIPIAMGSSTFSVNTPTTVAGVRGTVFFVFFDKGITGVIFKEGNGFVYNQNMPDKIVNVSAGQATFILTDNAPPLPPRPATEAEMMQYIKDTTIDAGGTIKDDTGTTQPEATLVDTADTMATLGQTGGEDTSAPKTTDTGVDSGPPPPVLPITETNTETLKDTIPPLITIASSPQATTNSTSGSFTVTANEPVTFTYSMDSVGVTSDITTSDTFTLAGLPEGSHTLTITATDVAGNVSTSSYSWTTDYTPPASLALSGTPSSITNVNSANIGATAIDATTITYSYTLDGAASTGALTGLTEGTHTFVATATDGAGNISTTTYSWTTDYTAPASLSLSGTPASITNINSANIGATANDANGVTYSYTLDGAASTGALTGLAEGSHTFVATAMDGAGNISTTSYTWTTDTIAPASLALSGTPASITNVTGANIVATAIDATTITYSYTLDGVTSTGALTGLAEGSHTFVATAMDGAGNVSTSSYSWTTDYTAPASLALSGTPASITNINNATIGASATDMNGVTYSYTLDGSPSTGSLTGLGEGLHSFVATATDGAGNTSTTSYTWTTDYTAPTASVSPAASPELTGATAAINVNFGSNETATYSYQLDGGGLNNVTGSSVNLTGIAEGTHTIGYSATDTAGNPSVPNSLSFALSRYSLSGSSGASGITGSITTGEVAGVSNQNWGGWKLGMSGTYTTMPSSFTLSAGGTSSDVTLSNNGGYWIDIISGTSDGVSSLSGTSSLKYLSYDRLGSGTGSFTGSYGAGTWSATDTGTYTETPLAFSGNIGFDTIKRELYNDADGIMGIGHTDGGLLGGTVPSLTNPAEVIYMGQYDSGGFWPAPYMWTPIIYSGNAGTTFAPSYDNNKFWGYIGGVWEEGTIDGKIYSLYIDQNGDAGIIKGSLTGAYYLDITAYSASGAWSSPVGISTGLLQTDLTDLTNTPNNTWNGINSSSGTITGPDLITAWGADGRRDSIANQSWGIWQTMVAGMFDYPITAPFTDNQWDLATESYKYMILAPYSVETITGTHTDGTLWSINTGETIGKIAGTTYGYGADIKTATPNTWISVGETIGTFDPVATTWQGVQTGAWLDTNRFLAMTQTAGGQAALTALNIPFAEVGKANLTGTNSDWTINMNNTTFFAYSNGAAPKIWATGIGDVNGSYNCSACGPTPTLTGNGLSANLTMQTWDTAGNKWMATVGGGGLYSGIGSMNGSIVLFGGAAAGTNTGIGPGTFTGTGAGVAK